ncbi:MAG: tetratricopeptide repeat protein [Thermodesulfobacteriota bacterium]|nr:tetratricopeptide repeat protein [Thermodesulfobacteriota bacterium]
MSPKRIMMAGALVIAVMVIYIPSLHCGFIWDDDYYVTDNRVLQAPGGFEEIWTAPGVTPQYYPMVFTSFWAEYKLFGLNAFIFHLNNVLLHAANAVLLWLLLLRLGIPWPWFAAALFALHPVQAESVTWISERKNVLSLFFGLASMLIYCRFLMARSGDKKATYKKWGLYGAALLLFTAALLSKSVTTTIPVVILMIVWWKRGRLAWRDIFLMLPFLGFGLIAAFHTAAMEAGFVGAQGKEWDLSVIDRFLIAGRAVWFYISKLIFPKTLVFIYPRWQINAGVWWQYLYPSALIGVLAGLWAARRRIGRGVFTGFACFVILLSPALGFVNFFPMKYAFVADHFQYHATPVMITLFAAGTGTIAMRQSIWPRKALIIFLSIILLAGLGIRTWQEQDKYENREALWLDTIAKNPTCAMALNNLGALLGSTDRTDKDAYRYFQKAVENSSCDFMAYYNLGMFHMAANEPEKAVIYLKKALECQPGALRALQQLGKAYLDLAEPEAAIPFLLKITASKPSNPHGHFMLGRAFYLKKDYASAYKAFSNVLMLKPDYPGAAAYLAASRQKMHRVFQEVE